MHGYGDSSADLMLLDFRVSSHEDDTNSYYCAKSGEILSNMLQNVLKLQKNEVYFTHIVKCKPLNANTPSSSEIESCRSYLNAQIEFVKPKVIVTLGEEAYCHFTGERDNFQTVRGHVIDFKTYKLIPIFHPQFLLRNPESKKIAMGDLQTIKSCL